MNLSLRRVALLLCALFPAVAHAEWNAANDEANRQRMMNSMRASAAAADRRNTESLDRQRVANERSASNRANANANKPGTTSRDTSAPGYQSSGVGSGPSSVVDSYEYTVHVKETEAETIARITREAQAGDKQSQFNLARIHYTGYGVKRDDAAARRWFGEAAAKGHAPAQAQYAAMLYNGQGGPADEAAGIAQARKAAASGDPYGKTLSGFYTIVELGAKPDADLREAVAQLEAGAAAGELLAQATLGRIVYFMGVGAPRDLERAAHYLKLAKDEPGALSDLARMTMLGAGGIAKDEAAAVQMIKSGAERGGREAQGMYALLLIQGKYVPKSLEESARYARMAALGGDLDGQILYAKALYFGQGVPKNLVESARWFNTAAKRGNQEAIDAMANAEIKQAAASL
ncbi:MAG: hypothetical protein V4857_17015 [Pseudomonadota bacterium]